MQSTFAKRIDITGKQFSYLTAIRFVGRYGKAPSAWECKCVCGKVCYPDGSNLRHGRTKSCGCKRTKFNHSKTHHAEHGGTYEDLTGHNVGKLTVLKRSFKRHSTWHWECSCDCGNITHVRTTGLIGKHKIRSCGCLKIARKTSLFSKKLSGLIISMRSRSKQKGWNFTLTAEDLKSLVQQPCVFCQGQDISQNGNEIVKFVGMDRKNSSKGYTLDNIQPCCCRCNRMKSDESEEGFLNRIKKIYQLRCI